MREERAAGMALGACTVSYSHAPTTSAQVRLLAINLANLWVNRHTVSESGSRSPKFVRVSMAESRPSTAADVLVRRLRDNGVRHVFGYPGGQLTPILDALAREPAIRHVLARDEQGAAFMADGYARATGRVGVCLAVCGPGVLNAATPLASAFTDSVPVLLISGQIAMAGRGPRSGYYHENDQLSTCATFTKYRVAVERAEFMGPSLDRALSKATEGRPGPVFVEVPLDVQLKPGVDTSQSTQHWPKPRPAPPPAELAQLVQLVQSWKKPLILAGGGVIAAGAEDSLAQLADRLGAPVFHTFMGKCAISSRHPLRAGLPWRQATSDLTQMEQQFSPLFAESDGLLALGCRFTQTTTGSWKWKPPASLAHVDIDRSEIGRHYPVALGIAADAHQTVQTLLAALPAAPRTPWAKPTPPAQPWRLPGLDLIGPLRAAMPDDAIFVADITRLAYIMLAEFPVYEPRTFLHPAGFVPMGFGIPAAIGAKAARPDKAVVAVVGDGCFLMSGMELASAVQEKLPIIIVLVNDNCLTLIKSIQERRYESRFLGVDLHNPDFGMFAKAFGVKSWCVDNDADFARALEEAKGLGETALIEVRLKT